MSRGKRKTQNKREYHEAHFRKRMEERHGLTDGDYEKVCDIAASAPIVATEIQKDRTQTIRRIYLCGQEILVVRDEATGWLTTALPTPQPRS